MTFLCVWNYKRTATQASGAIPPKSEISWKKVMWNPACTPPRPLATITFEK